MWVATDHSMTKDNFNLLWAFPLHILLPFNLHKKNDFTRQYLAFTFLFTLLILAVWFFLPQQMNNALLPLVLIVLLRSGFGYLSLKK
jgi:hypothetical protein